MFEYDNEIVKSLLTENRDFERLYNKHLQLKQKVDDVNTGAEALDETALEQLKKEKLLLKDKMAVLIEDYRRVHV